MAVNNVLAPNSGNILYPETKENIADGFLLRWNRLYHNWAGVSFAQKRSHFLASPLTIFSNNAYVESAQYVRENGLSTEILEKYDERGISKNGNEHAMGLGRADMLTIIEPVSLLLLAAKRSMSLTAEELDSGQNLWFLRAAGQFALNVLAFIWDLAVCMPVHVVASIVSYLIEPIKFIATAVLVTLAAIGGHIGAHIGYGIKHAVDKRQSAKANQLNQPFLKLDDEDDNNNDNNSNLNNDDTHISPASYGYVNN